MKIVFASTPSQEEEISELVRYIYSNIFPMYFGDNEISDFERLNILHPAHYEDFGTLGDAFQVMTSLQTLISILEMPVLEDDYAALFNRNVETLENFGIFFPFHYTQFVEAKSVKKCIFSVYAKAANEILI